MKNYFVENSYKASKGIASAVLVCLGIGLLLQTIGSLADIAWLTKIGSVTKTLFIPALGIGIAIALRTNSMVVICAAATAVIGGGGIILFDDGKLSIAGGEPVGAIIACLVTIWVGKRIAGKTNFDMILTPALCLLAGGLVGLLSSVVITPILTAVSGGITSMVQSSPLLSSMVISLVFALLILSPASSAALAIALQLDPTASAAALIGCSVQFTAFAFLGFKENTWGGFFAQLFCTPKLQTPNIIKTPRIMIIPLIMSVVMAPIGILLFDIQATNEVAGLGLCAFVAPLYLVSNKGLNVLLSFVLVSIILPALISIIIRPIAVRYGWLKIGDLSVELD